jgi:hypothetical protein
MDAQLSMHVYEVRPRKDHRGFDLISDALPFGQLWYEQAPDAMEYAKFYSRSHDGLNSDELSRHPGNSKNISCSHIGETLHGEVLRLCANSSAHPLLRADKIFRSTA